jgi:hypothetical protein
MDKFTYAFSNTRSMLMALAAFVAMAFAPAALQAQYCEGPINGANDEWITNVSFADVNNSTAFGVSTANTINATGNVTAGEDVAFTVGVTTDNVFGFDEAIVIYFDFDNDFTFETSLDLGVLDVTDVESTFDENSAPGGSNIVTMPTTPGTYRMRVVLDFFGPVPGPCNADNTSIFKDSEDYEIVVSSGGGPTCSDGIQNGDETGVDCGGSCPPCPPQCDTEYSLNINLDNFPSETTWEMVNINGTLADAGGPYSSADDPVSEELCLDYGCYEFTIFDSFGDGICCGFGLGDYSLVDDNTGDVVASGGAFGSFETTSFCTDPGPDCEPPSATANVTSYCSNGVFWVNITLSDLGSADAVTIDNSSDAITLQNVAFPRTYFVGPFDVGEVVDFQIYDQDNTACRTELQGLTDNCSSLPLVEQGNGGAAMGDINVFPNPTSGELNVNMTALSGETVNIRVLNAVGQLIEQRRIDYVESATEQFDLSHQQSGMYILQLNVEDGETFVKRVMLGDVRP